LARVNSRWFFGQFGCQSGSDHDILVRLDDDGGAFHRVRAQAGREVWR
jgi:hypothetical protein